MREEESVDIAYQEHCRERGFKPADIEHTLENSYSTEPSLALISLFNELNKLDLDNVSLFSKKHENKMFVLFDTSKVRARFYQEKE